MTTRMFVAIDLPEAIRRRLARLVADVPKGVRPVRPEQLHLTLHFLGDVADGPRAQLAAALTAVCPPAFTIDLGGPGRFPSRGRPTVAWMGVAENEQLASLHAAVGEVIAACGLPVEQRPFTPHVTLARLSPAAPRGWLDELIAATADWSARQIPVEAFRLFSSTPTAAGAVHVVEATYQLRADAC